MQIMFLFFILAFVLGCILLPMRKLLLKFNPGAKQACRMTLLWIAVIYAAFSIIMTYCTGASSHGYVLYIIFALCGLVGCNLFFVALMYGRKGFRTTGVILLVSYLTILFSVTLFGRLEINHATGVNMYIFQTLFPENPYSKAMDFHFIQNIALFIPAGAAMCLACEPDCRSVFKAFYYGCLLTILIETAQGIFHLGLCDIDDMIANIFGCMAGYGLMEAAGYFLSHADQTEMAGRE